MPARAVRGALRLARGVEVRRLGEDVGLEPAQLGPRLDADLLGQHPPGLGERAQRLGLPARPVQGEREVPVEPLAERVGGDCRLEVADELAPATEGELGIEGAVEGVGVGRVEAGGGVGHPRLARQLGKQRAVEGEGLVVEPLGRGVVAGGLGGGGTRRRSSNRARSTSSRSAASR